MNKIGHLGLIAFIILMVLYATGQTKSETATKKTTETIEYVIPEFDIKFVF